MNRSFLVPTVIACSAHALLMFGFRSPERRPVEKPIPSYPEPKTCCVPIALEDPVAILDPAPSDLPPLGKPSVAPPENPEPTRRTTDGVSSLVPDVSDNGPYRVEVPLDPYPRGPSGDPRTPGSPDGDKDGIAFPSALDAPPRARFQGPPAYPYALKSAGVAGEVLVEFVVDESGRVSNPRVLRSSHVEFEAPTLAAVSRWRFEPGTRKSRPVKFMMRVPVTFSLDN